MRIATSSCPNVGDIICWSLSGYERAEMLISSAVPVCWSGHVEMEQGVKIKLESMTKVWLGPFGVWLSAGMFAG